MSPKVSVMMVTARDLGMLPYQVQTLEAQSFRDFELVFVDELYKERKNAVKMLVGTKFPVIHIPPKEVKPYFAPGEAWNDGFSYCHGELVYFMADYILPRCDAIKTLWDAHIKFPHAMLSGRCHEVDIPFEDFITGKPYSYIDRRLTLYEHSYFKWERICAEYYESSREGVQNFWTGRNDAAPLDLILKCNGFDEQFDGAHGYHDDDLAQRMLILGAQYIIVLPSLAYQFPHKLESKPQIRTEEEQRKFKEVLIPQRIRDRIYRVNPHRDLLQEWRNNNV